MLHQRVRTAVLLAVLPLIAGCIIVRRPATNRYGALWTRSHYPDWETLVGQQDGIASYRSNPRRAGFGGFYERRFDNPYSVGLLGRYNQHELNQTYLNGYGTNATIDGLFLQPSVGWRRRPSDWFDIQLTGGPVITVNTGLFKFFDNAGLLIHEERRTHNGFNWQFGSSINVGPWNNWGLTAGYTRTNFFRKDADNNNTVHLGLWFDHVRIARDTPRPGTTARPPQDPTPPGTPRPPGDTTRAPPRPPGDTTRVPPRPPGDTTRTPPRPPETPPPSRPDSQEQRPTCCGFRGRTLTYPRLTDGRQPPVVQAAAWSTAAAASNVLLPNGAFFHVAQDLVVESVGFPLDWTRHYLSDLGTTAGGMIGHRWDFTLDKRVLPLGGTTAGDGLVQELPGQQSSVMYFNGQGRAETYTERLSNHREVISNFGTVFSAWVTVYVSPPGAFHEVERYVVYDPEEHPFKGHPNIDTANGEAIFYVLREKNGLRYVFNCRGQLIHILSRHDFTSYGALRPEADRDSVRVTIEYGGALNPLTQSPMPVRIRDTANRTYGILSRNIGSALLETNYLCRPERGARDIPRIFRLTGDGIDIEYQYRSNAGEAILEGVTITTGPIASTTRYAYDAQHRLTRLTPPKQAAKAGGDSASHENTYDGSGRVTTQVLGGGLMSWSLSYEGTTAVTARNGAGDEHRYALRQVGPYYVAASETLRSGSGQSMGPWTTRYDHNAATQVTRLTLPRGNVVRYEYDESNERVTLGPIRDFDRGTTYDNDLSLGNLLAVINESAALSDPDPVSITRRYAFEPLFNQILKETDPRGSVRDYEYRYVTKGEFGNTVRILGPALTQPDGSRLAAAPVLYAYNRKGQIETIVDQRGGRTRFTYAGDAWYVKQVELPGGGVRTYDVDRRGRVREEGGSFGTTIYRRDERGRVVTREVVVEDGARNRTFFEYDLHNQVTRTRTEVRDNFTGSFEAGGATIPLPVVPFAELIATTDFDLLDRPVREVVGGIERRYEYDRRGNVNAIISPSPTGTGQTRTEFVHDARGLVVQRTPGFDDASLTRFEYDENANLTFRVSGPYLERGVSWKYDAFDRVISQEDGRGTSSDRELDPNGNILREVAVGASGNAQRPGPVTLAENEYRYNELNKVIVVRRHLLDATGTVDEGRAFYTAAGDVTRMVNAGNEEKRFEYDVAGRTTAVIGGDLTTRTTYNSANVPTVVTESETEHSFLHNTGQSAVRQVNHRTAFTYDPAGRVTHQAGPGPELRYFYNSLGQIRAQYEEGHGLTETRYDAHGQRVLVQRGAAFERFEYLPSGHVARHVTPAVDRRWRYDDLGRAIETTDAKTGAATLSAWDGSGDEYRTRDANGTTIVRTFNERGLPTRLEISLASNSVDDNGVTRPTLVGPRWELFEYDGLGRPVRAATSLGVSTTMAYDGLGRIVSEIQERDGVQHRIGRSFAADQSWSEVLYPQALGGIRVRHHRAPSGAVQRVEVDGREVVRFQYSGEERITSRQFANGVVATYGYDADRRIADLQVSGAGSAGQRPTWWANAVTYRNEQLAGSVDRRLNQFGRPLSLSTASHEYDLAGRRIASTTTQRRPAAGAPDVVTVSGTYTQYTGPRTTAVAEFVQQGDEVVMGRLDRFEQDTALRFVASTNAVRIGAVSAQGGAAARDLAAVATLVGDSPTATERQRFRYDRAGNLIADSAFFYAYDHANRLTRVTERSRRGSKEYLYFVHDAFGRRVFMSPGREQTPVNPLALWAPWARQYVAFVYDGPHVIGELEMGNENSDSPVSLLARYVMGAQPGDRIRMDRRQNDEPRSALGTYYLHENTHGALALASDSAGQQHWIDYAPASGVTPFRPPNDLHTIGRSGTRSPYLASSLRVDGFSGIRYDERTRERLYDFRENRALADRVDMVSRTQQMHAFQTTSLATMAAIAAGSMALVGLPSTVAMAARLTAAEAGRAIFSVGAFSVAFGFGTATFMGTEYTFGMAAADFGEGALMGIVGGAMLKAGMSVGAIAAADFATGFWSGFIRSDPTESVTDAVAAGWLSGAFGAGLGLGIGTFGKWARRENIDLTDWRRVRLWTHLVPHPSQVATPRGLNARWQTLQGEGILQEEGQKYARNNTFSIFRDRAASRSELALERAILSYLRQGTKASRLVAALILKGELKIKFRETSASRAGAEGSFEVGEDFITININNAGFRSGNPARQIAATIVHEGVHYLGGGEPAAWFAHTKFLMRFPGGYSAIPGLRYLSRLQSIDQGSAREVSWTRQGVATLFTAVEAMYPTGAFSINPIHKSVLRAGGMGQLIGMKDAEVDFAWSWLKSKGGYNNANVPVFSY